MNKNNKFRLAFVASCYNEVNAIKLQIFDQNIENIDVFEYGTEPDAINNSYDFIEYNVRPDKTHGEILDLAQCISTHGFPDDEYVPPKRGILSEENKMLMDKATRHLRLENLEITLSEDGIEEITRDRYESILQEIMSNETKLSEMNTKELSKKMMLEQDPVILIAIIAVLFDKIHNIPMQNRYGQPSRGYMAKNGKNVIDFVNGDSIGWISELWTEILPKQDAYRKRKYLKSLRTRGKNMLREKASIWGLRFFINYLVEQDTQVMEQTEPDEDPDNIPMKIEYEGFEIDIDEDEIPFSFLLFIPLLSYSSYLEWYNVMI